MFNIWCLDFTQGHLNTLVVLLVFSWVEQNYEQVFFCEVSEGIKLCLLNKLSVYGPITRECIIVSHSDEFTLGKFINNNNS